MCAHWKNIQPEQMQMMYFLCQTEYSVRLARVESERQTLAEALTAAEKRASEEKHKVDDLQQQLRSAKAVGENAKHELQDYKNKASRILQVSLFVWMHF